MNAPDYKPPFSIEVMECGTWIEVDVIADYEDMLAIASSYAERLGDSRVMVTDAACREL